MKLWRTSLAAMAAFTLAGTFSFGQQPARPAPSSMPSASATTAPAEDSDPPVPAPPLPPEFAILQTRNVFGSAANHGGHDTPAGPGAGFVLKGVVCAGDQSTAFVEEAAGKQMKQLAAGDAVARGKIKSIELDAIEYEMEGAVHRIEVGQDFDGHTPPAPPPPPPAAPPTGGDGAAPPGQAGPVPPGGPRRHGPGEPGAAPQAPRENDGPAPDQ